MRICYAHDGTSSYDHLFLKYLLEKGHEVHLLTFFPLSQSDEILELPNDLKNLKVHHFNFHRVSRANNEKSSTVFSGLMLMNGVQIITLSSLVRKIRPDVLNGHFITTYGFWSALTFYHPFLLTIWGSDILVFPKQLRTGKLVPKFVLKRADAVIVDSLVQKQAAIDLGCDPQKIVSFPWAVDLERFNPKISGERIKKSLGWEQHSVIFCSRWHRPIYGIKYLLHAIPEIVKEYTDARFMIGGCGPLTDEFQSFVAKEGLGEYVKFVGKISHEEMPEYMAACDIYVSPSLSDGASATLLEAMACSKPVVVSYIPGNLEWITNNVNGFTVPTRDAEALTNAISELLKDEGLRKKFGTKNFEIVRERADLRKSLQLYEDTLMALASGRS